MRKSIQKIIKKTEEVSNLLKSLGHPKRLLILCFLYESEKTVNDLAECCQLSQPQVSLFLKRMTLEGILSQRREGKFIYYTIADTRIKLLIEHLYKHFC